MYISEVYNASSVAAYMTEAYSNRIPFLLEAYFPNKKKMGIDLKWIKAHKGLGVALKPSNLDALPPVRPRGQAQMTKEQMPLYRESMVIKEHDLIEISRIKESNDPYLQPVVDSMYDDTYTLVDGAEISAEWMRSQLFAPINGKMQISMGTADNTVYLYDYDPDGTWKSKNYLELTGSDTWDNPTAKPLNDIRKATQYLSSIGTTATTIIGNSTTFDYLLENEQVKNALISITGQTINFIDETTVEEVLRRKMRLEWIAYDKMFEDYDRNQKKFYPDDYITILGNGQLGNTWRGTTPEELTTIGNFMDIPKAPVDITVLESGIAVAIQNEYKPSFTVTTTASQIVLPSFEGMDSIFVIKVK
ncbi:MAG: phage capsid protein [Lachnospiraceae bacterium]|jgi:hypothetical protein|nr:phage capsid protein [Lachnospiraceae bacterium]